MKVRPQAIPRAALAGLWLAALAGAGTALRAASPRGPEQVAPARAYFPLAFRAGTAGDLARPPTAVPTRRPPDPASPTASPTAAGTAEPDPSPTSPATPLPTAPPSPTPASPDCGAITTFDAGLRPSAERHVSPGGNDANDGSAARPFASIGRALRGVAPGTAIRIHAGEYPGGIWSEDLRGSPEAPIWLGGVPGEARPVLVGGGEGLHLVRPAYLVVHDLAVRGASANGINADDGGATADSAAAHHVVFRGLEIQDIGAGGNQDCLKLSGLRQVWVLDSRFRACGGGGSAIDMVGVHQAMVARGRFEDLGANALQAKGGSTDVELRASHLARAGARPVNLGGSTGFDYFRPPLSTAAANAEARDIRVIANVIEGGQAALAFVGCVDCLAAHNTILDPDRWLLRILQETTTSGGFRFEPASRGRFVNNLVTFARGRLAADVNIGPNTAPETFSFAHNLWYAHDDPARSRPSLPVAESGAVIGLDPRLDAQARIAAGSPAAGAGLRLPEVRADAAGNCYADPPSIGAYELR